MPKKMNNNPYLHSIDPIEEAKLDQALNEAGQQWVAQSVKQLEGDELSMAWRSQLNERLALNVQKDRAARRRMQWLWSPLAGLASAGAVAVVMIGLRTSPLPTTSQPSDSLGAQAITAHTTAQNNFWLTGSIVIQDSKPPVESANADYEWQESDLGTL